MKEMQLKKLCNKLTSFRNNFGILFRVIINNLYIHRIMEKKKLLKIVNATRISSKILLNSVQNTLTVPCSTMITVCDGDLKC